jgi:hypothetical protein
VRSKLWMESEVQAQYPDADIKDTDVSWDNAGKHSQIVEQGLTVWGFKI